LDDASYIIGLMKHNTNALGFIPSTAIRNRWIQSGNYVIQRNSRGRPRGYILHGSPVRGRPLFINQACIDFDFRLHGFGLLAVRDVVARALHAGATSIELNCRDDLEATAFWEAAGFTLVGARPGGKRRGRYVLHYRAELARYLRAPSPCPLVRWLCGGEKLTPH